MVDPLQQDMEDLLRVPEIRQKEHRVLSRLLGDLRSRANHHLALQVRMGDVSSYLMSVTLGWVADKVGFAADLPIFRESSEGSRRLQSDPETVERIRQLQPDWRRQLDMAVYLTTRRRHKFPPLLLVGYQGWVYEERSSKWGIDARAMNESLNLTGLEPTGSYWGFDDTETRFYALDGQHRLMAILGLREIVRTGCLHALDENRNPRGEELSREDVIDHIHRSTGESRAAIHGRLQHLMDERIGVEVIPAVCMGESIDEALRRLRQTFVDVNRTGRERGPAIDLEGDSGERAPDPRRWMPASRS